MHTSIEKLVFGGEGLGHTRDGKTVFVWNALPGEEVEIRVTQRRRGILKGVAETVLKPSEHRISPREPHYLSCSPWQIMTESHELEWKRNMALETYRHIGRMDGIKELNIVSGESSYGYRNKMEFSFTEVEGTLSLALHERGQFNRMVPLNECLLASPAINNAASEIKQWLTEQHIPARKIKTLLIRSNQAGDAICGLFVMERIDVSSPPDLSAFIKGFHIYTSSPLSPASIPDECIYSYGSQELTEVLNGKTLRYGLLSFFQINIPVFETALSAIARHIEHSDTLLDYYSGVGAISIALQGTYSRAILVDSNKECIEYAGENSIANKCSNIETRHAPAEKALEYITPDSTIVFDPPRAGLHIKVIDQILAAKPRRIVYLSCNVSTHARDIALLAPSYELSDVTLYNFFPRTPHVESLAVLELK